MVSIQEKSSGRQRVSIYYKEIDGDKYNIKKQKYVSTLVAEAFIPNPLNLDKVECIDKNLSNIKVNNLRWTTAADINKRNFSRSVNQYNLDGTYIKTWNSLTDVKNIHEFEGGSIIACCKGKSQQAYNFKWRYKDDVDNEDGKKDKKDSEEENEDAKEDFNEENDDVKEDSLSESSEEEEK